MKTLLFAYPGDPVLPVTRMTGAEFLAGATQPREVVIESPAGIQRFDLGNEIVCDNCNATIAPEDPCALLEATRLYCEACFQRWLAPYIIDGGVS